MLRKTTTLAAVLMAAVAAWGQDKGAPAAPESDACMKHCREMAAAHRKMADERRAMSEKTTAAWKEIRASVEEAKKARGEKKVAALEMALDRLVAFHETMMGSMHGMPGMGCGGAMGDDQAMHGMHGAMTADCCAHASGSMSDDCPMHKGD